MGDPKLGSEPWVSTAARRPHADVDVEEVALVSDRPGRTAGPSGGAARADTHEI